MPIMGSQDMLVGQLMGREFTLGEDSSAHSYWLNFCENEKRESGKDKTTLINFVNVINILLISKKIVSGKLSFYYTVKYALRP